MIAQFNMENIGLLLSLGYEVDVACNMEQGSSITDEKIAAMRQTLEEMGVRIYHIPIPRKVSALREIQKSFRLSKQLMNERNYELIHCHSPIGGVICRISNRFGKHYRTTRMLYTAHGFHFFKGAPLLNWLIYYPVEWLCSFWTDTLITINHEDTERAKKLHAKRVEYLSGIGIDIERFKNVRADKREIRCQLGLPEDALLLLSVGELNTNKNHETVIRALAQLKDKHIHYAIAGQGHLHTHLRSVADQLDVGARLHLLGYRTDIAELYRAADVFVHPSFREGLPVSVMEAMASELPVIASKIRGNIDLIDPSGGILVDPADAEAFSAAIRKMSECDRTAYSCCNSQKAAQYASEEIDQRMRTIYQTRK